MRAGESEPPGSMKGLRAEEAQTSNDLDLHHMAKVGGAPHREVTRGPHQQD
jgi:hypothetical protein